MGEDFMKDSMGEMLRSLTGLFEMFNWIIRENFDTSVAVFG